MCDELQGSIVLHRGNFLEEAPEEQYELVLSNQVFEHIYEPWLPKYFDSLKASCAPGGVILLSTPNRWRPKNILRVLTFRPPEMMNPNMGVPPEQHLGHHRECSWRELYKFINQYFQKPEWSICIVRLVPHPKGSLRSLAREPADILSILAFLAALGCICFARPLRSNSTLNEVTFITVPRRIMPLVEMK